ncbi:MAG TPA: glycosyltransferase family 2 protein [Polyangiaceae bacterium]|jgi:hypothetical protein|nr:glycosyltransferase family 2 protein [Polyangiaceae bacterium]
MTDPAIPDVSIVTVNYRVTDLVRGMLDSVAAATAGVTCEVVVVDNASRDERLSALRSDYPWVKLIESPVNVGFSRGNNLGVRESRGRFLALVNPDVLLEPESLSRLVAFMKDLPNAGLVGPRIALPDGTTQSFAGELPTATEFLRSLPGTRFWSGAINLRQSAVSAPMRCGFVHGACMFLSRGAFERIGGIPAETFMYGEELLLGHRLRQAGYDVWYDPLVTVQHAEESSANRSFLPDDKALRKRWGHTVARAEILPRSSFLAWNSVMASRALTSAVKASLTGSAARAHHLELLRLHLSAFGTLRAPAAVIAPPVTPPPSVSSP